MKEWDSKYDDKFLLHQLYDLKEKENENIQEFNIRLDRILEKIPDDVKPLEKAITLHYMDAFDATFTFMLKEKKPTNLKDAQEKARSMEKHVSSTRKTDLLGSSSYNRTSQPKREDKAKESMIVDTSQDSMDNLISTIKQMMK